MKTLKIYILLFVATVSVAKAQFTKAELQVSGLTCSLCANSTEKAIKALPFVSEIKPDLIRNVFNITFKEGVPVDFEQITKKIKGAGFFVNYFKTTYNFANTTVAENAFTYGGNTYRIVNADKPLNGEVLLTVVDKGFAPNSVSKKYLGKTVDTPAASGKTYHVAI
ncbi:heavy-metal-associated domain-containing protein [Mucilaginibacter psychrotolerans]|uniref:Heavy-metal-associated domain-containing protein n=1 Tax=Mucilaginibacter psychrotolerans TaxID=1524096 RepID=A0A4Y8S6I5_9SPHI|nr:heavy metal-associated domain-containing protein [Mucilaginibacter psychrotolerans]TFF34057.1 heavy-metal-associated domain-containing protein [Mucilaginibacter psychrotolerans]